MGNEHSGANNNLNSPTTSTGVPASFSFLAKKRNSKSGLFSNSIVVVNDGTSSNAAGTSSSSTTAVAADPSADPDLKRLKEIPRFLPLLRGVLPGYRDLPDVSLKVDPRPIYRFVGRLQHHFRLCAETVTAEQGRLFAHIVEIDQLVLSLLKKTAQSSKHLDTLGLELKKADQLAEQLDTTQVLFLELARAADCLNGCLPLAERLPPLEIALAPIVEERRRQHIVQVPEIEPSSSAAGLLLPDGGDSSAIPGRISECRVVDSE